MGNLELSIFTLSKRKSKELEKLLSHEDFKNVKYKTIPNQAGGDIFNLEFKNSTQIYRFGWDWGQIVLEKKL